GAADVRVLSRSMRPTETIFGVSDGRRLGVAIDRIVLREGGARLEALHHHPALHDGFHDDEGTHRWTNGQARLPVGWFEFFSEAKTLEIYLASRELRYFAAIPAE